MKNQRGITEMLNYLYEDIYISEVPDEISMGISFTGCDMKCAGCHSALLQKGRTKGFPIGVEELEKLINRHKLMSCILFYGGEWEWESLKELIEHSKKLGYKTALYSGRMLEWFEKNYPEYKTILDYIKVGEYKKELGAITSKETNQRMYKIKDKILKDITYKFWEYDL